MNRVILPALALGAVVLLAAIPGCNGPEDHEAKSAAPSPTGNASGKYFVPGHTKLGGSVPGFKPPPMDEMHNPALVDGAEPILAWTKPSSWVEVPNTNSMRKVTYRVPHIAPDTDDGDASVAIAGGDVDSNVNRWVGQFEEKPKPKREKIVVSGLEVTLVELEGTYKAGGMMMPPPSGEPSASPAVSASAAPSATPAPHVTRLFGAIVDFPGEPYFFKLTGPKATITAARKDFDAWVSSIRVDNPSAEPAP